MDQRTMMSDPNKTFPAADGWRTWLGGGCPVPRNARVEVALRYAGNRVGPAQSFRWHHEQYHAYGADDVVAYRLVDDQTEPG